MNKENARQIMIECPNTIFHIYVHNEEEVSKLEIFINNIRTVKHLGLNDIYLWCNRHQMRYDTRFHYRKDFSVWKNMKSYMNYHKQKSKYQLDFQAV